MSRAVTKIGPADHGRRMSLDEFDRAEGKEGHRYELSRGVVTVVDVPNPRHLAIVLAIREQLMAYQLAQPGAIYGVAGGGECKLPLADLESERHPDLAVYKTRPAAGDDVWSSWIPELVVEVVSRGSEQRDYVEKREEYLAFGVQEYWVVDPGRGEMLALRRYRGRWREQAVRSPGHYATLLLPGFRLDLGPVLPA